MKKKECPSCAMEVDAESKVCPICQYEFPPTARFVKWLAIFFIILVLLYFIF